MGEINERARVLWKRSDDRGQQRQQHHQTHDD